MRQLSNQNESPTVPHCRDVEVDREPTAGVRLDNARSADREWRAALALRLHHRLRKLRQSDVLIQRWGAGLSVIMLLVAPALPVWDRIRHPNVSLWLILGAAAFAVGSLAAVATIAWAHDRTQNWIERLGLTEEHASSNARPVDVWACLNCQVTNPADATACSKCLGEKPVEDRLFRARVRQMGMYIGGVLGCSTILITGMLLVAWLWTGLWNLLADH